MTTDKRALVLGVTGQDGSYIADLLLEEGYEVHGGFRRSSCNNIFRVPDGVTLHEFDLLDPISIERLIYKLAPHEIYNEADQDHVGFSHKVPAYSFSATANSVLSILETVRKHQPETRVFQPLSATMFGNAPSPQSEFTLFNPLSPYACGKTAAYYLCRYYRQVHNIFVSTAIFYNHDSPRRGSGYLLDEIITQAKAVGRGERQAIILGSLDTRVDIGHAKEYMAVAHKMLQQQMSDDFVIGTGSSESIRNLAAFALMKVGVTPTENRLQDNPTWSGPSVQLISNIQKAEWHLEFKPEFTAMKMLDLLLKHEKSSKEIALEVN